MYFTTRGFLELCTIAMILFSCCLALLWYCFFVVLSYFCISFMVLQTYTVSIVQVKMRNCVVRQVQPSCSWVYNRAETPYKWEGGVNLWKDNTIEIWGEKNPFFQTYPPQQDCFCMVKLQYSTWIFFITVCLIWHLGDKWNGTPMIYSFPQKFCNYSKLSVWCNYKTSKLLDMNVNVMFSLFSCARNHFELRISIKRLSLKILIKTKCWDRETFKTTWQQCQLSKQKKKEDREFKSSTWNWKLLPLSDCIYTKILHIIHCNIINGYNLQYTVQFRSKGQDRKKKQSKGMQTPQSKTTPRRAWRSLGPHCFGKKQN